ncbi:MAG: response regulator, partial [Verrucomicrobia bacterium]|nr:response regulator [Verrucomicrobiota bacterium]
MDWLKALFSSSNFMPHGFCYTWDPYVIWLNAVSDALIALAYYTIPITLVYFVRRRKDLAFDWIFVCFAVFIVACGTTHVMEVVSIWRPMYWLVGVIKAFTAAVSVLTALALIPLIPRAIALPSPKALREANLALQEAQDALQKTNEALEARIAERTASLAAANAALSAEIEERKRVAEHLQESERQLRTAMVRSPIPAMIYDEEGVVRLLSEGWTEYSGYTLADIPSLRDWTRQAYNGRSEAVKAYIDKLFALSDPVREGEWTIRAKNGDHRVWRFHTIPLGKDRSGKRLLLSEGVDITEQKQAERQKDEFLALLAHELRNPLAPICSALHVIGLPAANPATVDQMRQMAERQVWHMSRLLDDLLDVARISQGRFELRKEPVEIGPALEGAAESVRPFCDERRHELKVIRPARPLWVQADRTRLEQVLINLLNNAAKYTDPGGRIRLSAEPENAHVVIRVQDTGIGIVPTMLPRIFELFVQVERRLNHSAGGVGIGLSLVKKLVELHGGNVEAFSQGPGKGSEFIVRLPAARALSEADPVWEAQGAWQAGDEGPGATHAGLRVLVVDDNVDAADGLAAALRLNGHEVWAAYDGPGTLAIAQTFRPQVVLLDLGLPGMDGYEVARQLREKPEMKRTYLVAVTGW